jgi:electron transfer flavoprotein beta subunit
MTVVACLKWLTPADGDDRFGGMSRADASALELALRLGAARGEPVIAITLGPPAADDALRTALAAGATQAVRVDATVDLDSNDVATALAALALGSSFVCCGDMSLDRGSGSVPAFLAALLDARQALGLIEVTVDGADLVGVRRLDGGRRERLRAVAPAVISVEGATAPLRRASLSGTLAARTAAIEVVAGPALSIRPVTIRPYRPRARVLAPPRGETALDRVKALLDSGVAVVPHGSTIALDPPAAAERILAALHEWGYLE